MDVAAIVGFGDFSSVSFFQEFVGLCKDLGLAVNEYVWSPSVASAVSGGGRGVSRPCRDSDPSGS